MKTLTISNVKCAHKILQDLPCAFTGKPMDVRLTVSPRSGAVFYAVITKDKAPYSNQYFPDAESLIKALTMRGGVGGVVDEDKCLVCPYTGDQLALECTQHGFRVTGGWNPYIPQAGPEQFAKMANARAGVLDESLVPPEVSVEDSTEPPLGADPLQEKYEEMAEDMTEKMRKAETAPVTVPVDGKVGGKKSKKDKKRKVEEVSDEK